MNISMPKNQTAAAMAVGEIAANAAAAAGASPEVVIQSAANRAGMDAAESAREQGMTQPQVEAAAAHEAEEAAKSAGATPDEAATAAGNLAVEVTKQASVARCGKSVAAHTQTIPKQSTIQNMSMSLTCPSAFFFVLLCRSMWPQSAPSSSPGSNHQLSPISP